MDHGEGKSSGDGGIDGIASGLHDLYADLRRDLMHADYNAVLGMDRMGSSRDRRRGYKRQRHHQQQNQ